VVDAEGGLMTLRNVGLIWSLAIVLLIASSVAWRNSESTDDELQRATVFPGGVPVDSIDRLVVEIPGEVSPRSMVFELGEEGWRQTRPFEIAADGFAIRQLLVAAADLTASRRTPIVDVAAADGPGLASLGLDPPEAIIGFEGPGFELAIELGARTVAGRSWVRIAGDDEVLVVDDDLHQRAIDDDPRNWRSRRLFSSDREIIGVTIENGSTVTSVARTGRRWRLASPVDSRADGPSIDGLLGVLGRVEHDGFVVDGDFDASRFGLADPAATITVRRDDGATETLIIGGPAGLVSRDRFAMIEGMPMVVRIDEATLRGLLPSVLGLIEPTGSGVRPADVKSIEITAMEDFVRLERDLDQWTIEVVRGDDRVAGLASNDYVGALIQALTSTRGTEVIVQEFPAQLAIATVVFHGFDGQPLDAVRIAREGPSGRWALENGDGVLRLLPASTQIPLAANEWPILER
jgi:hypothetical protein